MKISKDTGRGENIAGLVLWIIFIILYYCGISLLFRGSVRPLFFERMVQEGHK